MKAAAESGMLIDVGADCTETYASRRGEGDLANFHTIDPLGAFFRLSRACPQQQKQPGQSVGLHVVIYSGENYSYA